VYQRTGKEVLTVKRTSSYRADLSQAIREFLAAACFSRWRLIQGLLWTPQRIVWMALLMCWSAENTLTDRFDEARDVLRSLFPHWRLGVSYTGWYEAQARWMIRLQAAIAKRLRQQLQQRAGRYWTRENWCAFAVDGSRFECPRTAANKADLGCAGKVRTAPQLFLTTAWHMGTGLPWDFRIGPGTASERRHLEEMLADLPARALVVADAGFTGYDLYTRILAAKRSFLLRVGSNVRLLKKLGMTASEDKSTVYLWPDKKGNHPPLVLRLIVIRRKKKAVYLVTNERDEAVLSQRSATLLYEMRWGVEVFFRSCKQTLERRTMRSRTAESAQCELTWSVFGVWLLGLMSVAGMIERGQDPLRWSVAKARQRVRQAMRQAGKARLRGRPRTLLEELAAARQDGYVRRGSKKARNWPRKKQEKPPGAPKIKVATSQQRKSAERFAAAAAPM
jgi:Transposase DDE domain